MGGELQGRIDALLCQPPDEPVGRFSPYLDSARDLVDAMWALADRDAGDAVAWAEAQPPGPRLRHAVEVVVTNHRRFAELGLRVAPLAERAPHLVVPRRRP